VATGEWRLLIEDWSNGDWIGRVAIGLAIYDELAIYD
jgi:hypothetical protein